MKNTKIRVYLDFCQQKNLNPNKNILAILENKSDSCEIKYQQTTENEQNVENEIMSICLILNMELENFKKLSMKGYRLGLKSISTLTRGLKQGSSLQVLSLSRNYIEDDSVTALSLILSDLVQLQILDLSNNKIGDKGCQTISKFIQDSRTLSEFSIAFNEIKKDSFSQLLTQNSSIQFLDFSYNKLNLNEFDSALRGSLNNLTLLKLNVSGIQVDNKHLLTLCDILQFNHTLQEIYIDFSFEQNDTRIIEKLEKTLMSNCSLVTLKSGKQLITIDNKLTEFMYIYLKSNEWIRDNQDKFFDNKNENSSFDIPQYLIETIKQKLSFLQKNKFSQQNQDENYQFGLEGIQTSSFKVEGSPEKYNFKENIQENQYRNNNNSNNQIGGVFGVQQQQQQQQQLNEGRDTNQQIINYLQKIERKLEQNDLNNRIKEENIFNQIDFIEKKIYKKINQQTNTDDKSKGNHDKIYTKIHELINENQILKTQNIALLNQVDDLNTNFHILTQQVINQQRDIEEMKRNNRNRSQSPLKLDRADPAESLERYVVRNLAKMNRKIDEFINNYQIPDQQILENIIQTKIISILGAKNYQQFPSNTNRVDYYRENALYEQKIPDRLTKDENRQLSSHKKPPRNNQATAESSHDNIRNSGSFYNEQIQNLNISGYALSDRNVMSEPKNMQEFKQEVKKKIQDYKLSIHQVKNNQDSVYLDDNESTIQIDGQESLGQNNSPLIRQLFKNKNMQIQLQCNNQIHSLHYK